MVVKKRGRPKGKLDDVTFKFPTTEADFDFLVDKIMDLYNYTDRDLVTGILANRIMHSEVTCDQMNWTTLIGAINRFLAYKVAVAKNNKGVTKAKILDLDAKLEVDPNDSQAFDELKKFSDDGNELARDLFIKRTTFTYAHEFQPMGSIISAPEIA